jgi:hypothetical protein
VRIGMKRGCVIFVCISVVRHTGSSHLVLQYVNPLVVVEAHLGSIERWQSQAIMDMFLEEPKNDV